MSKTSTSPSASYPAPSTAPLVVPATEERVEGAAPDASRDPHAERTALLAFFEAHPVGRLISERRRDRMLEVLNRRITSVTMVLENLSDPHNVSAVVRTCEGFGVDTVHVVEQPNPYQRCGSITRGADRWVHVARHKGLSRCLSDLMAGGYTLAVADVGPGCVPVDALNEHEKVAIVMGSERDGLSRRAKALADVRFTIPMRGFTESFNVSVSAALALYAVTHGRSPDPTSYAFKTARIDAWIMSTVKHAKRILQESTP